MKKILVAIDESHASKKVLERARLIADKMGGDVLALTVITRVVRPIHIHSADQPGRTYTEYENPKEVADHVLANASKAFENYQGKFETALEFGDPASKIIDVAEEQACDLIIMGNRGLSVFKRVMMGSVSTKVLHHAPCSVMIVRA